MRVEAMGGLRFEVLLVGEHDTSRWAEAGFPGCPVGLVYLVCLVGLIGAPTRRIKTTKKPSTLLRMSVAQWESWLRIGTASRPVRWRR